MFSWSIAEYFVSYVHTVFYKISKKKKLQIKGLALPFELLGEIIHLVHTQNFPKN